METAQPMLTYLHEGWPTLPRKKLAGRAKRSANSPTRRLIRRITSSYQGKLIQLQLQQTAYKMQPANISISASPRFPSRIFLVRAVIYPLQYRTNSKITSQRTFRAISSGIRPEKLILLRSLLSLSSRFSSTWMMVVGDQRQGRDITRD